MKNSASEYSVYLWLNSLIIGNVIAGILNGLMAMMLVGAFLVTFCSVIILPLMVVAVMFLQKIDVDIRPKGFMIMVYCLLTALIPYAICIGGKENAVWDCLFFAMPYAIGVCVGMMFLGTKPLRYSPSIDHDPDALINQIGDMTHASIIND
ncbi:MAG: hypothetical protein AB8F95_10520 [Bacteroidia bacterium]